MIKYLTWGSCPYRVSGSTLLCPYPFILLNDVSACKSWGADEDAQSHVIRRFRQSGHTTQEHARWKVCSPALLEYFLWPWFSAPILFFFFFIFFCLWALVKVWSIFFTPTDCSHLWVDHSLQILLYLSTGFVVRCVSGARPSMGRRRQPEKSWFVGLIPSMETMETLGHCWARVGFPKPQAVVYIGIWSKVLYNTQIHTYLWWVGPNLIWQHLPMKSRISMLFRHT